MDNRKMSGGIILIIAGCLLLANQVYDFNFFSMERMWPVFVLIPGLIFEFSFFASGKNPGLLVPGGILTTIGALFFFETFTDWNFAAYTWPVYIFAVAVGLFQLYLFGERNNGLLIPVFILTTIAGISFAMMVFGSVLSWLNYNMIAPIALIGIGVIILMNHSLGHKK